MCESNVYIEEKGREELLMEAVDLIIPEGDQIRLVDIFGEQKRVRARLKETRLLEHKVILERI